MKNVILIKHPLVQHNLTVLRDERIGPEEFRRTLKELALLMVYEATQSLPLKRRSVKTPLAPASGWELGRKVILVPILRAGLGMLESILQVIPHAQVGFVGIKREESTLKAAPYHKSLPDDLSEHEVILMDPMLATGGSTVAALQLLKERKARRMRMVNVLAAPEGIRHVHRHFPGLPIFTAAVDKKLNERGYIVPGLGDAGDRLFGV